jgi:SAM-dependent methyltransferase
MEATTISNGVQTVLRIAGGFRQANVLFAAVELDVFDTLAAGPLTEAQLADRVGLHRGVAPAFLATLVALGLVERTADDNYRNSPAAAQYLTTDSPRALTGFIGFLRSGLYPAWDGLVTSLRSGKPANHAADDGDPYRPMYGKSLDRNNFLDAMDVLNTPGGTQLAALDWSGHHTVLDVGGGRGNLAGLLLTANPSLRVTVFDLPDLRSAFDRFAADRGFGDRLAFQAGDFFADELPRADAIVFAHVLHNWPVETRTMLLRKAFAALPPGGAVYVYDAMIDENDPQLANLLLGLDMLVWSSGGSEYTVEECRTWLAEAGFGQAERHPVGASSSVLVAHKPA